MLNKASVSPAQPWRAETRLSPSKAATSEEARRTLRYVEPLSDARTMLAGFFSILLAPLGEISRRAKSACVAKRHVHPGIVDHARIDGDVFRRRHPPQFFECIKRQLPQSIFRRESDRRIGEHPLPFCDNFGRFRVIEKGNQ